MKHLRYSLISNRHFISERSTGLQMLRVLDNWTEVLDKIGQVVDIVYLEGF